MTKQNFHLKNDKYRKDRGGYSRLLKLSCAKCGNFLSLYQKDGSGPLKRLYFDRIVWPRADIKLGQELICLKCGKQNGIPYIYKKEKRPAFLLEAGSVVKRVISQKAAQEIIDG